MSVLCLAHTPPSVLWSLCVSPHSLTGFLVETHSAVLLPELAAGGAEQKTGGRWSTDFLSCLGFIYLHKVITAGASLNVE